MIDMSGSAKVVVDWVSGGFDNSPMSALPVFIVMSLFLFVSCGSETAMQEALGEIPDTVSENFSQVTVSSTGRTEIRAARVEYYDKKDLTVFTNAEAVEFNSSADKMLDASAGRINLEGNKNGSAEGSIVLQDFSNDVRIEAEYLEWNDKKRLLTGTGKVRIESGDGITIAGEGFSADMARESYSFSKGVTGTLEIVDED